MLTLLSLFVNEDTAQLWLCTQFACSVGIKDCHLLVKSEILGTINLRCARFVLVGKIHHVPTDEVLIKEHETMGGEYQLRPV